MTDIAFEATHTGNILMLVDDHFDSEIIGRNPTKKVLIQMASMPLVMPNSLQKRVDKQLASNDFDTQSQYISNPLIDEEDNVLLEED